MSTVDLYLQTGSLRTEFKAALPDVLPDDEKSEIRYILNLALIDFLERRADPAKFVDSAHSEECLLRGPQWREEKIAQTQRRILLSERIRYAVLGTLHIEDRIPSTKF